MRLTDIAHVCTRTRACTSLRKSIHSNRPRNRTYSQLSNQSHGRGPPQVQGHDDVAFLSIAQLTSHFARGSLSPSHAVASCFSRMSRFEPTVNSFISKRKESDCVADVSPGGTKAVGDSAQERWEAGTPKSLLDGVPIALKDNICLHSDLPTTCASSHLRRHVSPYSATCASRVVSAGAVIVGKTNMDEFAMGSASVHGAFGKVVNPCGVGADRDGIVGEEQRVAGGSSGGSAAAVAAGMCYAALGSDTGGSVRLPASYCGIVGFKPSYGRIPRWGLVAYASSLDTVGILARTVGCAEVVYDVVKGPDGKDMSAWAGGETNGGRADVRDPGDLRGVVVGVPEEYLPAELSPATIATLSSCLTHLSRLGATIVPVSLPHTRQALSAYYVIAPAEASSNLARYDGVRYGERTVERDEDANGWYAATRTQGLGEEVKRRIMVGTYVMTESAYHSYFLHSQRYRRLVQFDFDRVFRHPNPLHGPLPQPSSSPSNPAPAKVNVLLTPTSLSPPPPLSSYPPSDPVLEYVNDVATIPASLAGLPACTVPFARARGAEWGGMPVGVQVIGQFGDEEVVLRVARAVEMGGGMDV